MALPSKFIPLPRVRTRESEHCIYCRGSLDGFAKLGSVLQGVIWRDHFKTEENNGESTLVHSRIPITKRIKGMLCKECQGEWRMISSVTRSGEVKHTPIVKVDTPYRKRGDVKEGFKRDQILNTRYTR